MLTTGERFVALACLVLCLIGYGCCSHTDKKPLSPSEEAAKMCIAKGGIPVYNWNSELAHCEFPPASANPGGAR